MVREEAKEKLWSILDKSKLGKPYCSSAEQYLSILDIVSMETDFILLGEVEHYARSLRHTLTNQSWFEKLHKNNGGIVSGGDDSFDMDFPAWIVAQGKELYDDIRASGRSAITKYAKKHNVSQRDMTYENLLYPFSELEKADALERTVCFAVITSRTIPEVRELVFGSEKEVLGYRFAYPLSFLSRGRVVSAYEVDIPVDALGKDIPLELSAKSLGRIELREHGDLLLSDKEINDDYVCPNLANHGFAGTLTAYLRELYFIDGYLD